VLKSPISSRATREADGDLDATRLVLDAIRLEGSRSRGEIAERTGFGRAVVAQRVAELANAGLITETGTAESTGGRPPRRLQFNADRGRILCADLGATSIDVALTDLSSRIIVHRAEPADIGAGPAAILGRVEQLFEEMLVAARADAQQIWAIGIGVPGPVEFATGRPIAPPIMPGWEGHPIRERFEALFGAPTWVDNDVNVMVMGEWRAGIARGHRNVVWVKIGTGIGAGLISDGMLHRGAKGSAGDVGHIQVVDEGVVCRCGNIGCLEALAGGQALGRDGDFAARSGRSPWLATALARDGVVTAETVATGAAHGDPTSVELIQRAGRFVGSMLATVVNVFNPSLVVLGGGVTGAGDLFLATIRETVYRRSLPLATRELQILPSALGSEAGVVGAAAVVADELFSHPQFAATLARESVGAPAGVVSAVR
jgi:glucokinase-like ROK family protein